MFDVTDLPQYRCHKVVRAAKITHMARHETGERTFLHFDEHPEVDVYLVRKSWVERHQPVVGGYLVCYDDGYESYSPAAAFEAGYTLLTDAE